MSPGAASVAQLRRRVGEPGEGGVRQLKPTGGYSQDGAQAVSAQMAVLWRYGNSEEQACQWTPGARSTAPVNAHGDWRMRPGNWPLAAPDRHAGHGCARPGSEPRATTWMAFAGAAPEEQANGPTGPCGVLSDDGGTPADSAVVPGATSAVALPGPGGHHWAYSGLGWSESMLDLDAGDQVVDGAYEASGTLEGPLAPGETGRSGVPITILGPHAVPPWNTPLDIQLFKHFRKGIVHI